METSVALFVANLPAVLITILFIGSLAAAVMGIVNLYIKLRPKYNAAILDAKFVEYETRFKEIEKEVKKLESDKEKLGSVIKDGIDEIRSDLESLGDSIRILDKAQTSMEIKVSKVDVERIEKQFDKINDRLQHLSEIIVKIYQGRSEKI